MAGAPTRWDKVTGCRGRVRNEALSHIDALYRTALRMTRSEADAEDIVQETISVPSFSRAVHARHQPQGLALPHPDQYLHKRVPKRSRQPQTAELDGVDEFSLYRRMSQTPRVEFL